MSVIKEQADSYLVRAGYEWARIFVQQGQRADGGHWGYISVISGYGNFGHCFSHCGGEFRAFLCSLDCSYLMGKFFGLQLNVFDEATSVSDLKRFVVEQRRSGSVSKDKARELWDGIGVAEGGSFSSSEGFYNALSQEWGSQFWDWEAWSIGGTIMNPQAVGFWKEIWPLFVAQLKDELRPLTVTGAMDE